jgi:hypothetical protein
MAHARPADLRDLGEVLARIRALPGVRERRPGVFWLRGTPFLHFHTTGDFRRAHAKRGRTWGPEIVLPFDPSVRAKAAFLREVRARHEACLAAGGHGISSGMRLTRPPEPALSRRARRPPAGSPAARPPSSSR